MTTIFDILKINGLSDENCKQFEIYYKLLIDWNEKINLTAITDETEVAYKHFLDSVLPFNSNALSNINFSDCCVIDVGTGAGFPGIPLRICHSLKNLTLVDSLNKRINFLNDVVQSLKLKGVTTVHGRAEELGKSKKFREKFDICVSRAVANMSTLSELCLPFVKTGGYFVSLKGPKAAEEVECALNAIKKLGGELTGIFDYNVGGTDLKHNIVIIKKISATSPQFPRKAPKPSKEPLE